MKRILISSLLVLFLLQGTLFAQLQESKIPVPKINFPDVDAQIEYIKKFDNWKYAMDNIESREEVFNFFGRFYLQYSDVWFWDEETHPEFLEKFPETFGSIPNDPGLDRENRGMELQYDFKNRVLGFVPSSTRTRGSATYNSLTDNLSFESSTSDYGGYTVRARYFIRFKFPPIKYGSMWVGTDEVEKIFFGSDLKNSNTRKFIRFLKKYYSAEALSKFDNRPKRFKRVQD